MYRYTYKYIYVDIAIVIHNLHLSRQKLWQCHKSGQGEHCEVHQLQANDANGSARQPNQVEHGDLA